MNESEEHVKSIQDYVDLLKRQKLSLLLVMLSIWAITLLLSFGLPAIYQSQATILVQNQQIPRGFVTSTVTTFAAQQIQIIKTRVLTVQNITTIVEKFDLYQQTDSNTSLPSTELAALFRESMSIALVSADVIDPKKGTAIAIVIAFTISFDDPSAQTAQRVASELVTLFLNENLRNRTDLAANTEDFFIAEAQTLDDELVELEQRLADFKELNEGSLPELYSYNLQTLERTHQLSLDTRLRIQQLDKQKILIASQLAQLSPSAPAMLPSGEVVLSDDNRLKALQSDYRRKAAIYSDGHPDVVRLSREVQALQAELGVETDIDDLRKQLQEQQRHLAQLQSMYKEDHQEIKSTRKLIVLLEQGIRAANNSNVTIGAPEPDNPAYILLQAQLDTAQSEIRSLLDKLTELENKIEVFEKHIQRAPSVEKDYQGLLRDYDNARNKYQDIKNKQREASISKSMEQGQKGERFIMIEPPALPVEPVSPPRLVIAVIGLVLGLAAGLGAAFIRDILGGAIHGRRELTFIMGEPPLVSIPYIDNELDKNKSQKVWRVSAAVFLIVGLLFVLFVHFFLMPLNVLYFVVLNMLGLG